jgi:hypothetical protein
MNVRFCPECKSLILADFRFCPYCGAAAAKGPEMEAALEGGFARMGAGQAPVPGGRARDEARAKVFAGVEESLRRLESDIDLILEEMAKEGRLEH